ncbi:PD-(D/E)XK nuclease domain-containing protein [Tepidimonas sp.]|uniref:PD-(D/E)XK nuclease domain-containing protein n=1 Tax=Tepidimonas sp. TaxID=2002775 RepID=UPI0028CF161B|nr:PD-(D/E)XK nuclease domain-containing protein [Tepidimonas sp.]MDT7929166.1 PD-(D/E)XK nuclease domain-containing protein [Tepidimonas sp.]
MEFKRIDGDAPTGEAMAQLRQRGYADKYRADGRPIWLLGVEFSSATRHVVGWDVQPA